MKRWLTTLRISLALTAGLAACDPQTVEVQFAEPFPVGGANLSGFAARDQGYYTSEGNATDTLVVAERQLLWRRWPSYVALGQELDSLKLPRRAGTYPSHGGLYRVQPVAAESFRVSWLETDTLFALGPGRLRRFRGWYYASQPAFYDDSCWQVQRLLIAGTQLTSQFFGSDTLRLRALDSSAVRQQREPQRLRYVLWPRTRRAIRQVHSYSGLWLPPGHYQRQ